MLSGLEDATEQRLLCNAKPLNDCKEYQLGYVFQQPRLITWLTLGFGQTSDISGLVDGGNVSFDNIATGYTYPFPKAQITYRTPDGNGFKLAIAVMDPNKTAADSR
jgi:hypothetical protein